MDIENLQIIFCADDEECRVYCIIRNHNLILIKQTTIIKNICFH